MVPSPRKPPRNPDRKAKAPGVPDSSGLERLLQAILEDDRPLVTRLLKTDPALALARTAEARLYQTTIAHWLYAQDTALHLAAAGHRAEIAKLLLAAGTDVNAAHNHRAGRPLHYAADGYNLNPSFDEARQVKTIDVLLDAGADLHAVDKNGATALHRAVRNRCARAVERLLETGADPTAKNKPGATPFHLAVQNTGRGGSGDPSAKDAQRRIIKAMLKHGVSPATKDSRGKSALDWATSEWIQTLLKA
ncbi:MAG: ankyrin repeat domain-containing protein [Planctomycetota bacterium]|nr:ankyrin repeat domain-containing protein [Planctomycetota bacterium]